jgi:uncharacterized protein (TIGR02611 family)
MKNRVSPPKNHGDKPPSGMMSRLPAPLKIVVGFALLIVGAVLALPGVPGPGILIMLLGLLLLGEHFVWARRLLAWGKKKVGQLRRRTIRKRYKNANGQLRASTETGE